MVTQTVQIDVPDAVSIAPVAAQLAPVKGFMSTEFGATVVAAVALGLGAVPAQYAPIVAGLVGLYAALRTLLKAAHVLGYAKGIPDLPAVPPLPAGVVEQTVTKTSVGVTQ